MLSPRWSSNAVRSGYAIEWRRSAATIHFLEAHNEVDENGDFNGCKLEGYVALLPGENNHERGAVLVASILPEVPV